MSGDFYGWLILRFAVENMRGHINHRSQARDHKSLFESPRNMIHKPSSSIIQTNFSSLWAEVIFYTEKPWDPLTVACSILSRKFRNFLWCSATFICLKPLVSISISLRFAPAAWSVIFSMNVQYENKAIRSLENIKRIPVLWLSNVC